MDKTPIRSDICPVCKQGPSFLTRRVECYTCKSQVCRDHSVQRDHTYCELCEKNSIKLKNFPDLVFQIKNLKSDLAYQEKDKKKHQLEINTKNDIISRLEKQYKTNSELHIEKVQMYEKKITQESEKIISEEKLILYLHQSLNESQKSENCMIDKLNFSMHQLHLAKNEFEEMVSDQKFLISKVDKLKSDLRGFAPIDKVGNIACTECKQKVKNEFLEVFETANILNGRDSFFNSIERPSVMYSEMDRKCCNGCCVM